MIFTIIGYSITCKCNTARYILLSTCGEFISQIKAFIILGSYQNCDCITTTGRCLCCDNQLIPLNLSRLNNSAHASRCIKLYILERCYILRKFEGIGFFIRSNYIFLKILCTGKRSLLNFKLLTCSSNGLSISISCSHLIGANVSYARHLYWCTQSICRGSLWNHFNIGVSNFSLRGCYRAAIYRYSNFRLYRFSCIAKAIQRCSKIYLYFSFCLFSDLYFKRLVDISTFCSNGRCSSCIIGNFKRVRGFNCYFGIVTRIFYFFSRIRISKLIQNFCAECAAFTCRNLDGLVIRYINFSTVSCHVNIKAFDRRCLCSFTHDFQSRSGLSGNSTIFRNCLNGIVSSLCLSIDRNGSICNLYATCIWTAYRPSYICYRYIIIQNCC